MSHELAISQMEAKAKELVKVLSPYERASLASSVLHALDVPGTTWSPVDYESYAEDVLKTIPTPSGEPNIPSEEDVNLLAVQAFESHAEAGQDLTDDDWDVISQTVSFTFESENLRYKATEELVIGDMIYITDYERSIYHELSIIETVEVDPVEKIVYVSLNNGQETFAVGDRIEHLPAR